jgi:hypothetical protein
MTLLRGLNSENVRCHEVQTLLSSHLLSKNVRTRICEAKGRFRPKFVSGNGMNLNFGQITIMYLVLKPSVLILMTIAPHNLVLGGGGSTFPVC